MTNKFRFFLHLIDEHGFFLYRFFFISFLFFFIRLSFFFFYSSGYFITIYKIIIFQFGIECTLSLPLTSFNNKIRNRSLKFANTLTHVVHKQHNIKFEHQIILSKNSIRPQHFGRRMLSFHFILSMS